MFYVPLCNFTLSYFNCTSQADGSWTLDAQPSLYCFDDKYNENLKLGVYGVVMYMIGIPLIVVIVLRMNRENVRNYCVYI